MMTTDERNAILDLAQGNPGALRVLADASQLEGFSKLMSNLKDAQAYGPRIWLLFKDINKENLGAFIQSSDSIAPLLNEHPSVKTEWDFYESASQATP